MNALNKTVAELLDQTMEDKDHLEKLSDKTKEIVELSRDMTVAFGSLAGIMNKTQENSFDLIKNAIDSFDSENKTARVTNKIINTLSGRVTNLTKQIENHIDVLEKAEIAVEVGGMGLVTIGLIGGNLYKSRLMKAQTKAFTDWGAFETLKSMETNEERTAKMMEFLNEDEATKRLEKLKKVKKFLKATNRMMKWGVIGICSAKIHSKTKSEDNTLELQRNATNQMKNYHENITNASIEIRSSLENMMNETEEILEEVKKHYQTIFNTAGRAICFDPDYSDSAECVQIFQNKCPLDVSTDVEHIDVFIKDMGELNEAFRKSYANFTKVVDMRTKIKNQVTEARNTKIPHYLGRHPDINPKKLCNWLKQDYPESKDKICDTIPDSGKFPSVGSWKVQTTTACSKINCEMTQERICPTSNCVGSDATRVPCPQVCVPEVGQQLDDTFRRMLRKHC